LEEPITKILAKQRCSLHGLLLDYFLSNIL